MSATDPQSGTLFNGTELELLFFGTSKLPSTTDPFLVPEDKLGKDPNTGEPTRKILFTSKQASTLEQIAEDRTFWIPLKEQQLNPRLALVFNQFIAQFRLACHRLCIIIFSKTRRPTDVDDISQLSEYAVNQANVYCSVHGIAYNYAVTLNRIQETVVSMGQRRQYLEICIDLLSSGYPGSVEEFLSLATAEFRKEQNNHNPVDVLFTKLLKKKDRLPINYRDSCWFHSACAFLMPSSRKIFDSLKRYELEKELIEGQVTVNRHSSTILRAIANSGLPTKPIHHATLPITETLVKFIYEALRIFCERRSTPMLNLIEIFANLYSKGFEQYGITALERNLENATDTATNLVTPFTHPWKMAPTSSASSVLMGSQNYSSQSSIVRDMDEFIIPSIVTRAKPTPTLSNYVQMYPSSSPLNAHNAKVANDSPDALVLKGDNILRDPYVMIHASNNHRVIVHITNSGFPSRVCWFLERNPSNGIDRDNLFSKVVKDFGRMKINDTITYTMTGCLFYVPGHYRIAFRNATSPQWYTYDDTNPVLKRTVGVNPNDAECNIIMLTRTEPVSNDFNYNLLVPISSSDSPPTGSNNVGIVKYGKISGEVIRHCRYILATNGLSPGGGNMDTKTFEQFVIDMPSRSTDPRKIICVQTTDDLVDLVRRKVSLIKARNKIAIIYYGILAPDNLPYLLNLSEHLAVMIVPPLSRNVCALTQQLCRIITRDYEGVDFSSFIRHLQNTYLRSTIRHQYFLSNFITPEAQPPVRHRWIPYIENGNYLLICHADRLSYLRAPGSQEHRIFDGETVEVWGKDVVESLDALDIPYGSKWFIYHSNDHCYLDNSELGRVTALLIAAGCFRETINVE